jgi:thymidine phosphorylase
MSRGLSTAKMSHPGLTRTGGSQDKDVVA